MVDKLERKWFRPVIIPAFPQGVRKMARNLSQNIWPLKSRFKPGTFWIGSKAAMHSVMTFSYHVFGYSKNVQHKASSKLLNSWFLSVWNVSERHIYIWFLDMSQ
jgi:hypothetical protein